MDTTHGRNNQQERGLSVDQSKIRRKLTSQERATWTEVDKKAYNALRLKEYRAEYLIMYAKEVISKNRANAKQEKKDALVFYKQHLEEQAKKAV